MAVVNETGDKMRDIIAKAAEELTVDNGDAGDEGTEHADDTSAADEGDSGDAGAAGADAGGAADAEGAGDAADGGDARAAGDVAPVIKEPVEPVAAEADKGVKEKPKKDEEHPFAKEHGIKSKDASGRENRIPFSRVLKITENKVKAAKAEWETAVLKPVTAKVQVYETRLGSIAEVEKIQFEQPRRYLAMLSAIPGYTEIFNEMRGGKAGIEAPEGAKEAVGTNLAADANDPEPQPDGRDEKGNIVGYTQKGLSALRAWDRRQAAREGAAAAKAAIEADLKPMRDRFQTVQVVEEEGRAIDNIINLATEWPGFAENHSAILDVVAKGTEKLDTPQKMYTAVQRAYNQVMFGAVVSKKETEEEARQRHFEEFQATLRRAPRSTAAASTVRRGEPTEQAEAVSSDDRMRNIIAESARKAGLVK